MISALRISNHDQNCFCRLIARHSRARIHALNLQRTSLTNTAHSPERAHSHHLARTACTKIISARVTLSDSRARARAQIPIALLLQRPCGTAQALPLDAISCLGAFRTPADRAWAEISAAGIRKPAQNTKLPHSNMTAGSPRSADIGTYT